MGEFRDGRYRPEIRWQFDWNATGEYDHPLSDVTEDQVSWSLRDGSAADAPSSSAVKPGEEQVVSVGGILADSATGRLSIFDRDGRFDPDNPNLRVNEAQLRRPVGVRVLYDGTVEWEGIAVPQYGVAVRQVQNFDWDLQGKHADSLYSRIEVRRSGGRISNVTDSNVSVNFAVRNPDRDLPLGTVTFNGPRIKFFEDLARMAGGWMVEDHLGNMRLRTMLDAAETSAELFFDSSYGYLENDVVPFVENPGLVRTRCTLAAQGYVPLRQEETGLIRDVSVGSAQFQLDAGSNLLRYQLQPGDARRIDRWLLPETNAGAIRLIDSSTSDRSIRINVISNIPQVATISFKANVSVLEEVNSREVPPPNPLAPQAPRSLAEQIYGRRELELPPWLTPLLTGGEPIIAPWLVNLSEPLEYFRISYPENTDTINQFNELRRAKPGMVANFQVETKQKEIRIVKGLILARRITGGIGRTPLRTLYGVGVRTRPPAPLVAVTAEAITPFEVLAQVRTTITDGRLMYVRLEQE